MQIHYFQRYHSKENVDTSNTMLMLSRLYNYNADKFFSMLNSLILGEDESPEITFDLQVVGDDSVPDAVISQKSFKIVVETKLYNQFYKQQLVNHLEQFGAEDIKVLLTLDPRPMKPQLFDERRYIHVPRTCGIPGHRTNPNPCYPEKLYRPRLLSSI